jgi:hypothetical protein
MEGIASARRMTAREFLRIQRSTRRTKRADEAAARRRFICTAGVASAAVALCAAPLLVAYDMVTAALACIVACAIAGAIEGAWRIDSVEAKRWLLAALVVSGELVTGVSAACESVALDEMVGTRAVGAYWSGADCVRGGAPAPAARVAASMVALDDGGAVLFGGQRTVSGVTTHYNDVHLLDARTGAWIRLPTTGVAPSARASHTAVSWRGSRLTAPCGTRRPAIGGRRRRPHAARNPWRVACAHAHRAEPPGMRT